MLRDRHRDAADVGFLERVGADGAAGHLTGDGDDGHRVHVRVGQRGDEVRGAGAGGGHADADPAGDHRIALGGVAGTLLVADQDVADLLGVEQRVVRGEDRAAGDAEDDLDAGVLQRPHEALRAGHLLGLVVELTKSRLSRRLSVLSRHRPSFVFVCIHGGPFVCMKKPLRR